MRTSAPLASSAPLSLRVRNVTTPRRLTSVIRQYEPPFTLMRLNDAKVYQDDGHFVTFQEATAK
ncbi:MAG: hypothetical protein SFW67_29895 [Myxococcaceae bacterium]|nr:hypothetical protein [Myxococcaceae bacterium]